MEFGEKINWISLTYNLCLLIIMWVIKFCCITSLACSDDTLLRWFLKTIYDDSQLMSILKCSESGFIIIAVILALVQDLVKGIVHPEMKIIPWFTQPQAILGVYDHLLSDEHNWSYIQKYPGSSKLYNGSEWGAHDFEAQKSASIHHKSNPHGIQAEA